MRYSASKIGTTSLHVFDVHVRPAAPRLDKNVSDRRPLRYGGPVQAGRNEVYLKLRKPVSQCRIQKLPVFWIVVVRCAFDRSQPENTSWPEFRFRAGEEF
jgi:hypothetical protein